MVVLRTSTRMSNHQPHRMTRSRKVAAQRETLEELPAASTSSTAQTIHPVCSAVTWKLHVLDNLSSVVREWLAAQPNVQLKSG